MRRSTLRKKEEENDVKLSVRRKRRLNINSEKNLDENVWWWKKKLNYKDYSTKKMKATYRKHVNCHRIEWVLFYLNCLVLFEHGSHWKRSITILVQLPYVRAIEWHASRFDCFHLSNMVTRGQDPNEHERKRNTRINQQRENENDSTRERERIKEEKENYTARVRTTVNASRFLMCKMRMIMLSKYRSL